MQLDTVLTDSTSETAQLRQQLAQLRSVLDASPSSILGMRAIRDTTGTIIDFTFETANAAVRRDLSYAPEELVGNRLLGMFPGNIESGFFDVYTRVTDTGQPERIVQYYTDVNGFAGWFEVWAVQQGPDQVVVTFTNITENKRAEQSALDSFSAIQSVMDSSPAAIMFFRSIRENDFIVDFEWVMVNKRTQDITGLSEDELVGHRLLEVHPHNKPAGLFDQYVQVVETGKTFQTEIAYQADGVDGWYDITAVRHGDGLTLTVLETSERRRAERAAQRQAALVESVLNGTQTAVACYQNVRDAAGRIVDFRFTLVNQTFLNLFENVPAEVLYTRTMCEMNPAICGTPILQQYVSVADTGQPLTVERESNGRWYLVSINKFDDGIITSSIDLTENRQYREQIEATNRALRQSNENLQSFAYVASHDLQEPLRKIRAFGDLLTEQYTEQLGPGSDYVRRMQAAAERMQALIKDLLALSRLSTQPPSFQPVALNKLVADTLTDLETAMQQTKAQVLVGPLPTIPGDSLQLRQLFQNLLSNALKFTVADREPLIRVVSSTADELPDEMGKSGQQYAKLVVSDNGVGFDADKYRQKIFGAFQRLHTREQYAGTGMGLAIVKKVVENHNGAIAVDSQEGCGTTFTIWLPIAP